MGVRRYRWTSFRLDIRPDLSNPALKQVRLDEERPGIEARHGVVGIDHKVARWASIQPPDISSVTRYDSLLQEVYSSYVHGDSYPALVGAVCLGERILNHLVLELRDSFSDRSNYKKLKTLDYIRDWKKATNALLKCDVIDPVLAAKFTDLEELRHPSVHFRNEMSARDQQARAALQLVFDITDVLFGRRHERFFWCPGEIYVRADWENDPLTKTFVLEGCQLVGPFYRIEASADGQLVIRDDYAYPDRISVTDDEFRQIRTAWQDSGEYPNWSAPDNPSPHGSPTQS